MKILLVNPNRIKPPLPPIGLDYMADHLLDAGHQVLFFNFAVPDGRSLRDALLSQQPDIVGITVRNIDNCLMFTPHAFIPEIKELVDDIRKCSTARIVLGGAGFTLMPMEVMKFTGADLGVVGDGEFVFPRLLDKLETPELVNNVVYWDKFGALQKTDVILHDIQMLAAPRRELVDYGAYAKVGGICNVQTKRGCNQNCIYCPEPQIMGRKIRRKSVEAVVDELRRLTSYGIDRKIFLVDSEYNVDYAHALAVAEEIIRQGIQITWSCYMTANNVDKNLIQTMNRAGCETIIWSVDSGCETMLDTLGKDISPGDVQKVSRWCDEIGQQYVHVLLVGGPGETTATIDETFVTLEKTNPIDIGIVTGIRIYPQTELLDIAIDEQLIDPSVDLLQSIYYRESYVRSELYPHVLDRFSSLKNVSIVGPTSPTPFTDSRFRDELRGSDALFAGTKSD